MNVRLYRAAFLRNPDTSGLDYWVRKRWAGTGPVAIANHFTASSEFASRYGSLSNDAFVTLIYQNIFDRNPDAGGLAFWTQKLDTQAKTRGDVMVNFSESTEHITKAKPTVDVVAVTFGLLGRTPTSGELATWVPELASGTPRTALISEVLGTEAYAARISS